jgi:hypothetical protein
LAAFAAGLTAPFSRATELVADACLYATPGLVGSRHARWRPHRLIFVVDILHRHELIEGWRGNTMRNNLGSALGLLLAIVSNGGTMAQTHTPEQTIWSLLEVAVG